MADISQELQAIMQAVYGEDVRGSIHNAIKKINDVSEVVITIGTAVTSVNSSVEGFFLDSIYINKNTYDMWQCTGTAWALRGNLKGATIASVERISTSGLVDTYQINLTNGQTGGTFTVTNGRDATGSTIGSLDDVEITSPTNRQIMEYDSTTQKWKNSSALAKTEEMIAPVETSPATNSHAIGEQIIYNDVLYDVIAAIAIGDTLTVNTNIAVADSVIEQIKEKAEKSDLTSIFATGTTNSTGSTISSGTYFYLNGVLVRAKADIASGATFTLNTNYEAVSAGALNELNLKKISGFSVTTTNVTVRPTSDGSQPLGNCTTGSVTKPNNAIARISDYTSGDPHAVVTWTSEKYFNIYSNRSSDVTVYADWLIPIYS